MPNIVTVKEIKKFLKLSDSTIYKLALRGDLPCFKIGDSWRFDMEEVVRVIHEMKKGNGQGLSRRQGAEGKGHGE